MNEAEQRRQFEEAITQWPYSKSVRRYADDDNATLYRGRYIDYSVDLAWEFWQKAQKGRSTFKPIGVALKKWESLQADGAEQQGINFRMNGEGSTLNGGRLGLLDEFGRVEWVTLGEKTYFADIRELIELVYSLKIAAGNVNMSDAELLETVALLRGPHEQN